jgi:hypothetical protein
MIWKLFRMKARRSLRKSVENGMPFPLALVRVGRPGQRSCPGAWDINSRASVLSAVMAILLAMSLGLNAVVLIAIGLYVVAAATLR